MALALTFTSLPTQSPVEGRRASLIRNLEEQKVLHNDPSYLRTEKYWTNVNGQRTLVEKQKPVHSWWRTGSDGSLVFSIRASGRLVEFEKGKAGIVVGSSDKLPTVIDTLIAATRAGELDNVLAQAATKMKPPQKKRST